jgi:hypothetical protein
MKQLNHSPEAAAAILGVSLRIAHERIAWLRKRVNLTQPVFITPTPSKKN